jgi:hypothetical protein
VLLKHRGRRRYAVRLGGGHHLFTCAGVILDHQLGQGPEVLVLRPFQRELVRIDLEGIRSSV